MARAKEKRADRWWRKIKWPEEMRVQNGRIYRTISEFECFTPPLPERIEDVRGWDLPVKEQYYHKVVEPEYMREPNLKYKPDPKFPNNPDRVTDELDLTEKQIEYRDKEREKIWVTGEWVMIKGVPYWIHGYQYHILNYWDVGAATPDGMKEYREYDMWKWLFWWNAEISPTELGIIELKHRRVGATLDGWVMIVLDAQSDEKSHGGHVNLTYDDGVDSFRDWCLDPFLKQPAWLPFNNNARPDCKEFTFTSYVKGTKDKTKIAKAQKDSLQSRVFVASTTMKSFVGKKPKRIMVDEFLLWDLDLFTWFGKNELALTQGMGRIKNGNIYIASTSGGDDEKKTVLNERAREFIEFSRISSWSDKMKRTSTGVRAFFEPSSKRLEGFIGKYGEPLEYDLTPEQKKHQREKYPGIADELLIGAIEYIANQLDHARESNNWRKYYSLKTLYPQTWEDPFTKQSDVQYFNVEIVTDLQVRILASKKQKENENFVIRGNLEFQDYYSRKIVQFVPDAVKGKFEVSKKLLDTFEFNRVGENEEGQAIPLNQHVGCITCDPYKLGVVINNKKASKGAGHGMWFFDYEMWSKRFLPGGLLRPDFRSTPGYFLKYLARPKNIDDFYEDFLMVCHWVSMRLALEGNIPDMAGYFRDKGYEKFVYTAAEFKDARTDVIEEVDHLRYGMVINEHNVDILVKKLARLILGKDPLYRGYDQDITKTLDVMPFYDTLTQMLGFDIEAKIRTKFDLIMSLLPGIQINYLKMLKESQGRVTNQQRFYEKHGGKSLLDMVLQVEGEIRRM